MLEFYLVFIIIYRSKFRTNKRFGKAIVRSEAVSNQVDSLLKYVAPRPEQVLIDISINCFVD